eukprot:GFKZ01002585.1.p1 GENE.GFKZ01002585.1~~GFKZ01002585.1.p1  ORF type:complete len:631 (-),score=52.40 GFKZ01002585.1:13-1848(-)
MNLQHQNALSLLPTSHSQTTSRLPSQRNPLPLLHNHKVLLIPSLLFTVKSAFLLQIKVIDNGGHSVICSSGEKGLQQATHLISTAPPSSPLNIFVCADHNLIAKYSSLYPLNFRPPRWLHESIRDSRFKQLSLYLPPQACHSSKSSPSPTKQLLSKRPASNLHPNSSDVHHQSLKRPRTEPSGAAAKNEAPAASRLPQPSLTVSHARDNVDEQTTSLAAAPRAVDGTDGVDSASGERRISWACEVRTCFSGADLVNNERICELLGVVLQSCQAKKEHFRAIGYQRAIAKIKGLRHDLMTLAQVRELCAGRGVGHKIEAKIMEVITTGRLRQAEAVLENVDNITVRDLCQVWGVGPVKALNLIAHGIKSILDLRDAVKKDPNILDRNQKIGLRHYEDLLLRIPRRYVAELERFVAMVAKSIDQNLHVQVAGSYLRGKKDCGDVDIIIRGTESALKGGFPKLINALKKKGVLTDDLIIGGSKYFGIFRFPGRPHGRVDLFAVPEREYPFALLTYTGSAVFNRYVGAQGLRHDSQYSAVIFSRPNFVLSFHVTPGGVILQIHASEGKGPGVQFKSQGYPASEQREVLKNTSCKLIEFSIHETFRLPRSASDETF